jgi:hypothetical protein
VTALIVTIRLNTEPDAVIRGWLPGDVLSKACEIRWGHLGRDLHGGDLRLHLPGRLTWDLTDQLPERVATRVLTVMYSPREDVADWESGLIWPWRNSGGRPFITGDVMTISSPGPFENEHWDLLPVSLARRQGGWTRIELKDEK